jgi:hypothetical protein
MNRVSQKKRLKQIVLLLSAMIAIALPILIGLADPQEFEIVRYRNALIADADSAADFNWTPAAVPRDYFQERASIPLELTRWHGMPPNRGDTLARALAIARALSMKPRAGGPIRRSTIETLAEIDSTGGGYCADYVTVFSALSYANGLTNRIWGFSFDGFGGHGHIFNEIWDAESQKWSMIDVFHGFYPLDQESGESLSALEFRRRLLVNPTSIRWQRLNDNAFAFKDDLEALTYYQRGAAQWYLWWGNAFLSYDQHPFVAAASHFGRLPERIAGVLTTTLPRLRILVTDQNRAAIVRLFWLKYTLLIIAIIEIALSLLVVLALIRLYRERHIAHEHGARNVAPVPIDN